MKRNIWERLRRKYKKIDALKEFGRYMEKVKMDIITENKNSMLYDEQTTAKRLSVGHSTLKLLRRNGQISHVRIGRRVFYRLKDIENFITKSAINVEN